jgi:hypothetical protein
VDENIKPLIEEALVDMAQDVAEGMTYLLENKKEINADEVYAVIEAALNIAITEVRQSVYKLQ